MSTGIVTLETDVTPKKARVLVDGEEMGFAKDYDGRWDRLSVAPGRHKVEFRADGYQSLTTWIDTRDGGLYRLAYALEHGSGTDPRSQPEPPAPAARMTKPAPTSSSSGALRTGRLRIAVSPEDAAVYLDGTFLARGDELASLHGAVPVASGSHLLEVVRPGYETVRREVSVDAGVTAEVRLELPVGP